jgi:hypothetical protein
MFEPEPRKKNKLKLTLFIHGSLLAGLSSLTAFAGIDFRGWPMFTIIVVSFPATGCFVALSWCPLLKTGLNLTKTSRFRFRLGRVQRQKRCRERIATSMINLGLQTAPQSDKSIIRGD